jgi:hypothetical protein
VRIRIAAPALLLGLFVALPGCCGSGELEAEKQALAAELEQTRMELLAAQFELEECQAEGDNLQSEIDALARAAEPPSWGGGRVGKPGPENAHRCVEVGDHYEVPAAVAEDLGELSMSIRVVPHFRAGETAGFKLYGIPGDSLPASCGFTNSDVIVSLNGIALTGPAEGLEAYTAVMEANEALFVVEHRGEPRAIRIVASEPDFSTP